MIVYDHKNFIFCLSDPEEPLSNFLKHIDDLLESNNDHMNYKLSDVKIDDKRIYQALILKN